MDNPAPPLTPGIHCMSLQEQIDRVSRELAETSPQNVSKALPRSNDPSRERNSRTNRKPKAERKSTHEELFEKFREELEEYWKLEGITPEVEDSSDEKPRNNS